MPDEQIRVGVIAGRSVGKAVQRNRAKRMLREAAGPLLPDIKPGVDMVLIARAPILKASLTQVREALRNLLIKGNVLINNGNGKSA
jgi:ribonuclease P protein component